MFFFFFRIQKRRKIILLLFLIKQFKRSWRSVSSERWPNRIIGHHVAYSTVINTIESKLKIWRDLHIGFQSPECNSHSAVEINQFSLFWDHIIVGNNLLIALIIEYSLMDREFWLRSVQKIKKKKRSETSSTVKEYAQQIYTNPRFPTLFPIIHPLTNKNAL